MRIETVMQEAPLWYTSVSDLLPREQKQEKKRERMRKNRFKPYKQKLLQQVSQPIKY
jgi:hypothetical protein